MTKDEALKLALEALQEVYWSSRGAKHDEAIIAIKEALAPTSTQCEVQGELCSSQEPVIGTRTWFEDGKVVTQHLTAKDIYKEPEQEPWCMKMNGCKTKCEDCPDEAAKPKRPWGKPWVSLTDDEYDVVFSNHSPQAGIDFDVRCRIFCQKIEAKLKELNT